MVKMKVSYRNTFEKMREFFGADKENWIKGNMCRVKYGKSPEVAQIIGHPINAGDPLSCRALYAHPELLGDGGKDSLVSCCFVGAFGAFGGFDVPEEHIDNVFDLANDILTTKTPMGAAVIDCAFTDAPFANKQETDDEGNPTGDFVRASRSYQSSVMGVNDAHLFDYRDLLAVIDCAIRVADTVSFHSEAIHTRTIDDLKASNATEIAHTDPHEE
jgi:hypothetical protein